MFLTGLTERRPLDLDEVQGGFVEKLGSEERAGGSVVRIDSGAVGVAARLDDNGASGSCSSIFRFLVWEALRAAEDEGVSRRHFLGRADTVVPELFLSLCCVLSSLLLTCESQSWMEKGTLYIMSSQSALGNV
jgi:hypothetical protein